MIVGEKWVVGDVGVGVDVGDIGLVVDVYWVV